MIYYRKLVYFIGIIKVNRDVYIYYVFIEVYINIVN